MKKAIISRTVKSVNAVCKFFADDSVHTISVQLPAHCNTTNIAERYIRKNNPGIIPGKLIFVERVESSEKLIGMELDDFIANATKVSERSKDTRNCVTKEVQAFSGTALYMDETQSIKETVVTIPQGVANVDAYVRKNYKFDGYYITTKNITPVSALYAMDEKVFASLAKPMANKFKLA